MPRTFVSTALTVLSNTPRNDALLLCSDIVPQVEIALQVESRETQPAARTALCVGPHARRESSLDSTLSSLPARRPPAVARDRQPQPETTSRRLGTQICFADYFAARQTARAATRPHRPRNKMCSIASGQRADLGSELDTGNTRDGDPCIRS